MRSADDRRGQERGHLLPGHDHGDEVGERRGGGGRRLGAVAIRGSGSSGSGGGGGGGVAGAEVVVELPVGAGEDEERQRDEAQHGGQPAEQVRHR